MPAAIRMGFIGAGQVAQEIHLPVLSQIPAVEPLVLCDLQETSLGGAFRKFGIRETTSRYQDVLEMREVDAVLIALPNYLHARVAQEALAAGKHVLCEKPSGITVGEAEAVRAAASASGRVYMMALPHRFDTEAQLAKGWIEKGHLGRAHRVRAGIVRRDACPSGWFTDRSRSGGGALMQLGSYLLDLTLWLFDNPRVERVSAFCVNHALTAADPHRSTARATPPDKHDVEDSAVVLMRMDGARFATVEAAWSLHCETDRQYLEIYGDEGGATLWPLRLHRTMDGMPVDIVPRHDRDQSYKRMARHFVDCVTAAGSGQRLPPIGSAEDGLRLARLMSAIYESASTNREVDVEPQPLRTP